MNSRPFSRPPRARPSRALLVLLASGPLSAQSTTLVSFDGSGQLPNDDAYDPVLSTDGRFVAFQWYDNLTKSDIYLRDLVTGAFELVRVASNGARLAARLAAECGRLGTQAARVRPRTSRSVAVRASNDASG